VAAPRAETARGGVGARAPAGLNRLAAIPPRGKLPRMTRRRALWILAIVWLGLGAYLLSLEATMQDAGGYGIIDFELAFTSDRAQEILTAWGDEGRDAARLQLWLDYLYLVVYGLFLWLAVKAVRDGALKRGWTRYARPGAAIAILPLVAAGADAIEDVFLLLALGGHGGDAAPLLGGVFAVVKFAALTVTLLYLLVGLVGFALHRRAGRDAAAPR
jgi:hypothetical protein